MSVRVNELAKYHHSKTDLIKILSAFTGDVAKELMAEFLRETGLLLLASLPHDVSKHLRRSGRRRSERTDKNVKLVAFSISKTSTNYQQLTSNKNNSSSAQKNTA